MSNLRGSVSINGLMNKALDNKMKKPNKGCKRDDNDFFRNNCLLNL